MRGRSCDQSVIDGQRALLHIDLVVAAALALEVQLALMRRIDDRLVSGEHTRVLGSALTGIQDSRGDLPLGHTNLDATPGEPRVEGVVVAVNTNQRLLRDSEHPPPVGLEHDLAERPQLPLLDQALSRNSPDPAVEATVGHLSPAVELVLEVEVVREGPSLLEVIAHEPVRALQLPLRLSITSIQNDPANPQLATKRKERLSWLPAPGDR
jgi:hypothetical protein